MEEKNTTAKDVNNFRRLY